MISFWNGDAGGLIVASPRRARMKRMVRRDNNPADDPWLVRFLDIHGVLVGILY